MGVGVTVCRLRTLVVLEGFIWDGVVEMECRRCG